MKSVLCTTGYLLLALSLLMAGVPVHAMAGHDEPDRQAQIEVDQDTDSAHSGKGGCPHHASDDSAPVVEDQALQSDLLAEECCGPDCRCSCAGLTLIPIPRFATLQSPGPATNRPAEINHLPSLTPAPLLRPPQIS